MKTSHRVQIAKSWLTSFFRSEWLPEHYPVYVKKQTGVPENARWCARVLNWAGPMGFGTSEQEARAILGEKLRRIASHRRERGKPMPRPGTGIPIEFASTARIDADEALLDEFIGKALGYTPNDPVFISDESRISDFGDDERVTEICQNIQKYFGVVVDQAGSTYVVNILDKIRKAKV